MARKRTDDYWREWTYQQKGADEKITAGRLSSAAIAHATEENRDDPPSDRVFARLLQQYKGLNTYEQRQYQLAMWPQTFEAGLLPWSASPSFLELTYFLYRERARRPSVRLARWYWRVWMSTAPAHMPVEEKARIAQRLAMWEAMDDLSNRTAAVQAYLAYQPWNEERREKYFSDIDSGLIAPMESVSIPAGLPASTMRHIIDSSGAVDWDPQTVATYFDGVSEEKEAPSEHKGA